MSLYTTINEMIDAGKASWDSLFESSKKKIPEIEKNPEEFRTDAEKFVIEMRVSRKILDEMKPLLRTNEDRAKFSRLAVQYQMLRDKFLAAGGSDIGVVPVMIYLGVTLSVAAMAWAYSMAPYAEGYRIQAQAVLEDLRARELASKEGRSLQPATVEPPKPAKGLDLSAYIVPGVLVVGVIGAIYWMKK